MSASWACDGGDELGGGDVAGAGLADVGVGAGLGDEIAGAVAVGDAGLEHLGGEPLDAVGDGGLAGRGDRDAAGDLAGGLVVGGLEGGRGEPGVADGHLGAASGRAGP